MRPGRKKLIWIAPLAMLGIAALLALCGWVVMQLWNWLLPPLFGWHALTFWQALGLLVLCRLLFAGLGRGGRGRWHWRRRMDERWDNMTPEEREKFRQGMRGRCGHYEAGPASPPNQ